MAPGERQANESGLHRLDPDGAEHGFWARFQRTLINTLAVNEESSHLRHHVEDLGDPRAIGESPECCEVAGEVLLQDLPILSPCYGQTRRLVSRGGGPSGWRETPTVANRNEAHAEAEEGAGDRRQGRRPVQQVPGDDHSGARERGERVQVRP
jgi:hypothetical protein